MKYKNDILLIGVLLLFCFISFGAVVLQKDSVTDELQIYCDGALLSSVSIDQRACILLYCDNGSYHWKYLDPSAEISEETEAVSSYNVIRIDQGTVSVCDADCGGKDCVRQKEIAKNGETIICLPHRLVLCLTGAKQKAEDAVAW